MMFSMMTTLMGLVKKFAGPIFFYMAGRSAKEKDDLKDENKRLKNRPRTDNDVVSRLSRWRDKLPKD